MKAGDVDFTVSNATPARAVDVSFSQTLISLELGYLVPAASPIASLPDVDKPGLRVGVTQGSTSQGTIPKLLPNATVVPAQNAARAIEMFERRELDLFATNKPTLFEMSDQMPGARVLDGRWGVENIAVAIPRGREAAMEYLRRFVEEAQTSGLLSRAVERAGLRGVVKAVVAKVRHFDDVGKAFDHMLKPVISAPTIPVSVAKACQLLIDPQSFANLRAYFLIDRWAPDRQGHLFIFRKAWFALASSSLPGATMLAPSAAWAGAATHFFGLGARQRHNRIGIQFHGHSPGRRERSRYRLCRHGTLHRHRCGAVLPADSTLIADGNGVNVSPPRWQTPPVR